MENMDGIMRCSRYSFGPNRLHYCGPDANKDLKELIEKEGDSFGFSHLLKQFKTLFPYLREIASTNKIEDPFDARVVEAYWLGNELLETVEKQKLYDFLVDDLHVKDKLKLSDFYKLEEKIKQGALPHHSFHVLNIWTMEGHNDKLENLERMNECIISSGIVKMVNGSQITIATEPLVFDDGKIGLGQPVLKNITRQLEAEYDIEQIKSGEIVSVHWSVPCEVITQKQAENLRKFNLKSIEFANFNL